MASNFTSFINTPITVKIRAILFRMSVYLPDVDQTRNMRYWTRNMPIHCFVIIPLLVIFFLLLWKTEIFRFEIFKWKDCCCR